MSGAECEFDGPEALPELPLYQGSEPETVYRYESEAGALVYVQARYPGKKFIPYYFAGGHWKAGLNGKRVLYRLPEVADHLSAGRCEPIRICEGEKDADALAARGETATCGFGGAGAAVDRDAEYLRGARHVVVHADNDDAGRSLAGRWLAALQPRVDRVEVVLPALDEPKADVTDHLAAGLGLDDFLPLEAEEEEELSRFRGLSYAEALRAEIPATTELVAGLVDAGTVGVLAGLPFTRKSWAALELAHKVAAGTGNVFGRCGVVQGGPVVYLWQDDSDAKELERIQLYASRNGYRAHLPLRFLLNEGVRLPDDVDELARLLKQDGAVLLVVDSLYNTLSPTVKLKDEEVAVVLAQLKAGICDRTGASVALVDHAPWPTENNRGQRRAYGSVFKTAAVRWSIHLEADARDDTRLHVEASGNNVAGLRRTPATWNEEALEIRLLDVERESEEELDETVLAWVVEHPGEATSKVASGVSKRRETVENSLERLGRLELVVSKSSRELGRAGTGTYWFALSHVGSESPQDAG